MGYKHVEIVSAQSSKRAAGPCGDVLAWRRSAQATTVVCADGIGSGIKANVAATLCTSRLMALVHGGMSLRQGFGEMVRTMNRNRAPDLPFAAFTAVRVLNDGQTTALSYEMPQAVLVSGRHASVLAQRTFTLEQALISESSCYLEPGEGLLVVTDGITQAGLGRGMGEGWGAEAVAQFVSDRLVAGASAAGIPQAVHDQARRYWGTAAGDDCTAALLACRLGSTVNILTGPPSQRERDGEVVARFLAAEGIKIVCGATTARIVARQLGRKLDVEQDYQGLVAPPRYVLDGVDLVTEGAVTLNQVYNILEENPERYEEQSGVTDLCCLLRVADRVTFTVGAAMNPGNWTISFRQRGILPRSTIVPLLGEKLEKSGKLVVTQYV